MSRKNKDRRIRNRQSKNFMIDEAFLPVDPALSTKLKAITADMPEGLSTEVRSTPSSSWKVDGEGDPHAGQYDGERAELTLGQYTDDQLANGIYMNYDRPFDIEATLARREGYHPPIAWMTAGKERIRWLSRALEKEITKNAELTAIVKKLSLQACATTQAPAPAIDTSLIDGAEPTHRCKVCGAQWRKFQDAEYEWNWNLCSKQAGQCCDNVLMGDQIEAVTPPSETFYTGKGSASDPVHGGCRMGCRTTHRVSLPQVHDRADGVKGHYCVGRCVDGMYTQFWSTKLGDWCSTADRVLSLDEAEAIVAKQSQHQRTTLTPVNEN